MDLKYLTLNNIAPFHVYSAVNLDFTPQWNVGDTWEIITRKMLTSELGALGGVRETPGGSVRIYFEVMES
jgi:hypothetical protein